MDLVHLSYTQTGDLRRHGAHYDVIVMDLVHLSYTQLQRQVLSEPILTEEYVCQQWELWTILKHGLYW